MLFFIRFYIHLEKNLLLEVFVCIILLAINFMHLLFISSNFSIYLCDISSLLFIILFCIVIIS